MRGFSASLIVCGGSRRLSVRLNLVVRQEGSELLSMWRKLKNPPTIAAMIIVALWLIQWTAVYCFFNHIETLGQIGDSFATVNTLFSGAALVGVIIAIIYQSNELELQRKEMLDTREVLEQTRQEHAATVRLAEENLERERIRFTLQILEEKDNRESYLRSRAGFHVLQVAAISNENLNLLVGVYSEKYPNAEFDRVYSVDLGSGATRNADQDLHDLDYVLRKWHLWMSAAQSHVVREDLVLEQFKGTWSFWQPVLRPFLEALRESAKSTQSKGANFPWLYLDQELDTLATAEQSRGKKNGEQSDPPKSPVGREFES